MPSATNIIISNNAAPITASRKSYSSLCLSYPRRFVVAGQQPPRGPPHDFITSRFIVADVSHHCHICTIPGPSPWPPSSYLAAIELSTATQYHGPRQASIGSVHAMFHTRSRPVGSSFSLTTRPRPFALVVFPCPSSLSHGLIPPRPFSYPSILAVPVTAWGSG